jgi:hypothetical protein
MKRKDFELKMKVRERLGVIVKCTFAEWTSDGNEYSVLELIESITSVIFIFRNRLKMFQPRKQISGRVYHELFFL